MVQLQIVTAVFALGMLYWSYLSYRRGVIRLFELAFWLIAWGGAVILALRPSSAAVFLQRFSINRTMDLFLMVGFMLLWVVLFFNHLENRKLKRRLSDLVRQLALREGDER